MRKYIALVLGVVLLYGAFGYLFPSDDQQLRNMGFESKDRSLFSIAKALPLDYINTMIGEIESPLTSGEHYSVSDGRHKVVAVYERYSSGSDMHIFTLPDNDGVYYAIPTEKLDGLSVTKAE